MNKFKNFLWGIVLIILGVILGLNALDITHINIFFDGWWTLFIIVPCFIGLLTEPGKTGNFIGLVIGVVLLLCCLNVLNFELVWKLLLPAILIIIGLSFLFKDSLHSKINKEIKKINQSKNKENEYCSTFSSQDVDYDDEVFQGANLTSVFGGLNLDLRKSTIKENQVINCSAIFGGIDIYVPKNVKVKVKSNSIFGGVDNHHKHDEKSEDKHTLYINSTCLFGEVEIK